MSRREEAALEDCLRALEGGARVEDCLSRYPDLAPTLEPLLRLAAAVREAARGEPPPSFALYLKKRLLEHPLPRRRPLARLRWAFVAASLLLAAALSGWGVVSASAQSLPGDLLYPMKTAQESFERTFTFSLKDRARLEARLAQRRSQEMVALAKLGRIEEVKEGPQRLRGHLERLGAEVPPGEVPSYLVEGAQEQLRVMEEALDRLPPAARPFLERALVRTRLDYEEAFRKLHRGSVRKVPFPWMGVFQGRVIAWESQAGRLTLGDEEGYTITLTIPQAIAAELSLKEGARITVAYHPLTLEAIRLPPAEPRLPSQK